MKIFITIVIGILSLNQPLLSQEINCKEFISNSEFKYEDDYTASIKIFDKKHIECFSNGCITSKIKWIDDCSYQMIIVKNTIKNSPLKKNAKATIQIVNINGNKMNYKLTYKGQTSDLILIKIK